MRKVNLSRIPAEKKRASWERMKERYPAQAAWVKDPFVKAICAEFKDEETGETVCFNPQLIVYLPDDGQQNDSQ